jgi:ATP-dependent RNA helicase SUPV3L1/SUV3
MVRRLWEACQLPDFRKASPEDHARLAGRIAHHILSPQGRIPREWIGAEMERLDSANGDLDVLQQRLAQVRTWTFAASRSDWLADAEHWRERTRAVEDKLSDALHEALTQRFIDRRTSALLKGLKREDAMLAGVSEEGEVTVEGHFVGSLEGLEFKPDPRATSSLEGRAVRNAALRALRPELSRRLARIAAAEENAFQLAHDGRVRFDGAVIAKLAHGAPLLKPRLDLIGAEDSSERERAAARERLEYWLARKVGVELRPLAMLEAAWREGRLPADARGLAFRLIENAGALDRRAEALDHISGEAQAVLRKLGVRIGRLSVFMPALVRPRAAETLAVLRHAGRPQHPRALFLPRAGALSAPLEEPRPWAELAAAGYRGCGRVAVRFGIVERLADALAQPAPPGEAALARLIGRPARQLAGVLGALHYKRVEDESGVRWTAPGPTRGGTPATTPDGPFAALADLMPSAPAPHRRRKRKRA